MALTIHNLTLFHAQRNGRPHHRTLLALGLGLLLSGCGGGGTSTPAQPQVVRTAALSINPRPVPTPGTQDVIAAVDMASQASVKGTPLTYRWSQLEPAAKSYQLTDLANAVSYFGNTRGFDVYLGIQPINTVPREVPPDLQSAAFDSPAMKLRFHSLLDAIKPLLNSHVKYLSIGNEVDIYLATHPSEWAAYQSFYEDALVYAHQILPGMQVGVTTTFVGASGTAQANVAQLNTQSDIWIFTYYPVQTNFVVETADAPLRDFPVMLQLAGAKPVLLQEVGYPSSTLLNSSETQQAQMMTNVFGAWQAARTRIPFLSVFALHDFTDDVCTAIMQYYGQPANASIKAYFCSLGLRHTDGSPKPSWQSFAGGAGAVAANP